MGEKRDDRRVRRTKKMLRTALVTLMHDKKVQDISVREITELADFNRGTFYLHYKDVFDMLDHIEQELVDELEALLGIHMPSEVSSDPIDMLRCIFDFLHENADIGRVLLGPNGDLSFVTRIQALVRNRFMSMWLSNGRRITREYYDYFSAYVVSGFVGLSRTWLDHDMKETPEEMAQLARRMITHSTMEFFG